MAGGEDWLEAAHRPVGGAGARRGSRRGEEGRERKGGGGVEGQGGDATYEVEGGSVGTSGAR